MYWMLGLIAAMLRRVYRSRIAPGVATGVHTGSNANEIRNLCHHRLNSRLAAASVARPRQNHDATTT